MSRNPTPNIDYTSKDYESFRSDMLKALDTKMPEYTDRSQTDAGIVIIELLAQGLDILSFYQDTIANECLLPTAEQRSSVLKWCNILSYTPKFATPSRIMQVFKLSSAQEEPFVIPKGTIVSTKGEISETIIYFETENDLTIPAGKLGDEKEDGKYLYQVSAVQGVSVSNELVGSSNGTKNQSFLLKYSPVISDSISIYIDEGFGFEPWTQVSSFIDSSPLSKDFTVSINDRDEATITFGDGVFGKIPRTFTNGIFANYRTGGGSSGNVGANKVTIVDSPIALVSETFNPDLPYEQGFDKESIESMKMNAPNAHRTVWGALTESDFADVIKQNFPEVKYAQSVQNSADIFSIDLYILLQDSSKTLTEEQKKEYSDLFDKDAGGRELAGLNRVTVYDAKKKELSLIASLVVSDDYSKTKVENSIREFLTDYFALGNYDFNTELSLTALSSEIMNPENAIEGIKSFKFTSPDSDIIKPEAGEILTMTSIVFSTTGGVE